MRQLLRNFPPRIVSRKCVRQSSASINVGHRRRDAAFGHDRVRFAKQRLANDADRRALAQRFDGRAQPCAARADDQHIVFVSFELFVHSNLRKL